MNSRKMINKWDCNYLMKLQSFFYGLNQGLEVERKRFFGVFIEKNKGIVRVRISSTLGGVVSEVRNAHGKGKYS